MIHLSDLKSSRPTWAEAVLFMVGLFYTAAYFGVIGFACWVAYKTVSHFGII
mgnify:CR=1 FL=1